jgi:hypothetical protein
MLPTGSGDEVRERNAWAAAAEDKEPWLDCGREPAATLAAVLAAKLELESRRVGGGRRETEALLRFPKRLGMFGWKRRRRRRRWWWW